jgi:cyclic pyranopterin phosphate synthase
MSRHLAVLSRESEAVSVPAPPPAFDLDEHPLLRDGRGRRYVYLRLSVTDRCDLACRYCMPENGEDDHALRPELMTFEENARLVAIVASMGIGRVRFTGGEPLVRKNFLELVRTIHHRAKDVQLVATTNATRLAPLAAELRRAGLCGVNISLDSLDPSRFRTITRGGDLGRVIAGIDAAVDAGLEVKLNTVAMRGVNDDELGAIVDWARARGITPRFIELMPLGEGVKMAGSLMSAREILERLGDRVSLEAPTRSAEGKGPARYVEHESQPDARVGIISAVSNGFCDECNRIRVTARGDLRTCLASQRSISIRDRMRSNLDDRAIAWAMCWALAGKHDGHRFDVDGAGHEAVGMSLVGG